MNRFLRLGILSTLAGLFLFAFLGGCAAPASTQRTAILSLPYNEFDQSYGSGFRLLYDREEYLKAAVLIEDYLKAHYELTAGQQKFLHLHAAQMFALGSENTPAVKHLDLALSHEKTRELGPNWNDMLAATRAFLMHNRKALVAAKERLAAAKSPQRVDNLLENFGSSYADVLLWHRVCSNVAVPKDASIADIRNGAYPSAALTVAPDNYFYGSTAGGGTTNYFAPEGMGTMFKVSPTGTLTTLALFSVV